MSLPLKIFLVLLPGLTLYVYAIGWALVEATR